MKNNLRETRGVPGRSAELHSAVSQIFNLLDGRKCRRLSAISRLAECNSAIRQITNLRYEAGAASRHALLHFQSVTAWHKRALTGLFIT